MAVHQILQSLQTWLSSEDIAAQLHALPMQGSPLPAHHRLVAQLGFDHHDRPIELLIEVLDEASGAAAVADDHLCLVHFLRIFPFKVTPAHANDVARLVLLLNSTLEFPGLGYEEASGIVYHRYMLPISGQKIDRGQAQTILSLFGFMSDLLTPPLEDVSTGARTLQDVMQAAMQTA